MNKARAVSSYCTLAAGMAAGALAGATPASAQQATAPVEASEDSSNDIIVTARRRDERLQDVPAAISALGTEQLKQYAITSIGDAARMVPQLLVSKTTSGTGAAVFIRGIGTSALSSGYDQSVGINVDNVQINRGNAIYIGYLDMAQFEVLKGPQALYFGKNSPAGVISIRSNDPTQKAEFIAMAGYEVAARQYYGEAVASGPLSDKFMVRLAMRYSHEDGFFYDDAKPFHHPNGLDFPGAADSRYPNGEEMSARFTAVWQPNDAFTNRFKAFWGHIDGQPAARDTVYCSGPNDSPVFGLVNTADNCKLDRHLTAGAAPVEFTKNNPTASRDGRPIYLSTIWLLGNDATYNFGKVSLNSITSYYNNRAKNWVAFWGGSIFGGDLQNYDAFSEELRLSTDFDGPLNFVVGGYYQSANLYFSQSANIAAHGASPEGRYDSYYREASQKSKTKSLFVEGIWDITDQIQLDGGARATWETKDWHFVTSYVHPAFAASYPLNKPLIGNFKDDNISPQATLTYKPSEQVMVYGAYRTGYKSGGFNSSIAQTIATTVDNARFKSEKARSFEAGAKFTLMNRRLFLNTAVYDTQVKDLQVLAFDSSTISFFAQNAGKLKSRGVEFEANYDGRSGGAGLQLRGNFAYNFAEYADYIGPCYTGQSQAAGCDLNPKPRPVPDLGQPDVYTSQDFNGKTPPRAPRVSASAGVDYSWKMDAWTLGLGGDLNYTSKFQTQDSLSPYGIQKGFLLVNAKLTVDNVDGGWTFSIIGKNLTDKIISMMSTDISYSGSGTGTATGVAADLQGTAQVGRTVAFQIQKRF